ECLFVPVEEFLEGLERIYADSPGKSPCATLRVFPMEPRPRVRATEHARAATSGGTEAAGSSSLPGFGPDRSAVRADEARPGDGSLVTTLSSVEALRRQFRLRLGESHARISDLEDHARELARRNTSLESELLAARSDLHAVQADLHEVHQSRAW